MQINHNIRAMVTQHALFQNNNGMSKSLEKLSTGLRINRAQDDAAGLAMSEQMRTQIRGLGKAKQNTQDGIAALQIAEGGLAEISNLMQRQRELAVQAANDTLTSTERNYLDEEFQELSKEIGRIALTTDYNGKNMLSNGSINANGDTRLASPNNSFGVVGEGGSVTVTSTTPGTAAVEGKMIFKGLASSIISGNRDAILLNGLYRYFDAGDPEDFVTKLIANAAAGDGVHGYNWVVEGDDIVAKRIGNAPINSLAYAVSGISIEVIEAAAATSATTTSSTIVLSGDAQSFTLHIGPNYSSNFGGIWSNQTPVTYHGINFGANGLTGAEALKDFTIGLKGGVGVNFSELSISGSTGAHDIYNAIDGLDAAIKSISGTRAKIGTYINRLEYTVNNIANLEFNTQDAESRIRDTDFAKETTNFTRNQIMVQSATSMLAQANSLPQSVLGLLG